MFTALLNREVAFMAATMQADAYGGQSVSMGTVLGYVPCRVRQLSATEREMLMREGIDASFRIYTDGGISVLETYVARLDDGNDYEVKSVHNPDLLDRHLQIDVNRKRTGTTSL
jgi:hypothetical protein